MKTRTGGAALGAALTLMVLAGPTGAAPSITLTSPANNSVVSRSQTPSLALAGGVTFDVPQPTSTQFFVRRQGCGTANDNLRLSVTSGTDNSGCGTTGAITPLNEIGSTVGVIAPASENYSAVDGLPVTLDAAKPITGVITLSSYQPPAYAGAGTVSIQVTLSGTVGVDNLALGTTTVGYTALPAEAPKSTAWSITPPSNLDKNDLTSLTLNVLIRGVHAMHGFMAYGGASHLTVPSYSASFNRKVEIAADSGTFSSAGVTLAGDLASWTGSMTTPGVGGHFIRARAVQGGQVSGTATNVINVTA